MHKEPPVKHPPPVPIPVMDNLKPWVAYPQPLSLQPGYLGNTFEASCKLWEIVNDLLPMYYNAEAEDVLPMALIDEVKRTYHRLLIWSDTLPNELRRSAHAPPHVLILQ